MAATPYADALVTIIPDVLYSFDVTIGKANDAEALQSAIDDRTEGALALASSLKERVVRVQDILDSGVEGVNKEVSEALSDGIECCRLLSSALSPGSLDKNRRDGARSRARTIQIGKRVLASMKVLCDTTYPKGAKRKGARHQRSPFEQCQVRKSIWAISEDYQSLTLLLHDRVKETRQDVCPRCRRPRTDTRPGPSVPSRLRSKLREAGASLELLSCASRASRESRRSRSIDRQLREEQLQPWTRSDCVMAAYTPQRRGLFKPSLVAHTCEDRQKHLTELRRQVVGHIRTLVVHVTYMDETRMPEEAHLLAAELRDRVDRKADGLTDVELGLFEFLWSFEAFRSLANERGDGSWADDGPLITSVFGKARQIMRDDDYVLTVNDTALALKKVAFHEAITLTYSGRQIGIADPHGHPSWGRRWRQRFGRTPAFIGVFDLDSYDTAYDMDPAGFKIFEEYLHTISYIAKQSCFRDTTFLLYLVNVTRFREKVKRVPLADWVSGFSGGSDPDEAAAYIVRKLASRVEGRHRLRVRMCDHMDPRNVDFLFASVDHAMRQKQILQRFRGYNSAAQNT